MDNIKTILNNKNKKNNFKYILAYNLDYNNIKWFASDVYSYTLYDYMAKNNDIAYKDLYDILKSLEESLTNIHDLNYILKNISIKNIFVKLDSNNKLINVNTDVLFFDLFSIKSIDDININDYNDDAISYKFF